MSYVAKSMQNRVIDLSANCYNKALEYCKNDSITDAVAKLSESLLLDKTNLKARNLLGLCYYRIGDIISAISQWKISVSIKMTDNIAVDYLKEVENSKLTNKMIEAVKLYNEALGYANDGNNSDMAIMCLKKAVYLNKDFTAALCLLSLCYIDRGNTSDAQSLLQKAYKIDKSDVRVIEYLNMSAVNKVSFFKNRNNKDEWDNTKPTTKAIKTIQSQKGNVFYFIGGILVTGLIVVALVVPSIIKSYSEELEKLEMKYNILQNDKETQIAKNDETILRLSEENESLKSKLYTTGAQELQQRVKSLSDIKTYFDEGNVEIASDKMLALNTSGFSAEVMNEYNALKALVLPMAAKKYYNTANELVDNGDAQAAQKYFDKCIKCTDNGDELRYSAMYQLGKIAVDLGDKNTAINNFNTVVDKHPVSSIKKEAAEYIEKLTQE